MSKVKTRLTFDSQRCPGSVVVKGLDDEGASAMIVRVKKGVNLGDDCQIHAGDWFILPVTDKPEVLEKLHKIGSGAYPKVKQALIDAFPSN